jgi:hypothetical protein
MGNETSVTLHVTDAQNKPVAGALVNFIAAGVGLTNGTTKTDTSGRIQIAWPANPAPHQNFPRITGDTYNCIYTVKTKSATTGQLSACLKKGQHHDLRVQINGSQNAGAPVAARATALVPAVANRLTAEDRFKQRAIYPPSQRSEKELLEDLVWGAHGAGKLAKGTKFGLGIAKYNKHHHLDEAIKAFDTIEDEAWWAYQGKYLAQTKKVLAIEKRLTLLKNLSHGAAFLSVASTIVTGLYEIKAAVDAGDGEKLANEVVSGIFRLATVLNPWVAGVDLIMSICFGSDWPGKVIALFVPDPKNVPAPPQVVQASLLTNVKEFSRIGSCPVVSGKMQYRIDVSTRPYYGCKSYPASPLVPGLAFDGATHGQLVYVDVDGAKHPIMLTDGDAKALPARIEYLVRDGLL